MERNRIHAEETELLEENSAERKQGARKRSHTCTTLYLCAVGAAEATTYVMTDVIGIRRVLSSRVLTVTTVPVSASRRKISTVMSKSEPSRRKVSWGRSSVMKITSAALTCFRLGVKTLRATATINPFLSGTRCTAHFKRIPPREIRIDNGETPPPRLVPPRQEIDRGYAKSRRITPTFWRHFNPTAASRGSFSTESCSRFAINLLSPMGHFLPNRILVFNPNFGAQHASNRTVITVNRNSGCF